MNTYTLQMDLSGYEFIKVMGYGAIDMQVFARCNLLGTLKNRDTFRATRDIYGDSKLLDLYAYSKSNNPKIRDITWMPHPMWDKTEAVQNFLRDQEKVFATRPLVYPSGEQIRATVNNFILSLDHNGMPRITSQNYMYFEELHGTVEEPKWEVRIVHGTDPVHVYGDKSSGPVDYIFGLSELAHRIDTIGLMECSALVIPYSGEESQTREYVLKNAVRKGWDAEDIKILMDLLSSGRVVFAGYEELYTGPISPEFRLMCTGDLAMYEHKAGRNFRIGIEIGEDIELRVEQYLHRDKNRKYRYDEHVCPIRKLGH